MGFERNCDTVQISSGRFQASRAGRQPRKQQLTQDLEDLGNQVNEAKLNMEDLRKSSCREIGMGHMEAAALDTASADRDGKCASGKQRLQKSKIIKARTHWIPIMGLPCGTMK